MKKTFLSLLFLAALSAGAQSVTNFIQTGTAWISSFNTNLTTFDTNHPYQVWVGTSYQNDIRLGADVGAEANPFAKAPGVTFGDVMTLADTVGTISRNEIDLGWSVRHFDVRLTFGAGAIDTFAGGGNFTPGWSMGVYAQIEKAMTQNTGLGARLEGMFMNKQSANIPMVKVFVVTTF